MGDKSTNNNIVELATFAGGCFWCMVSPFDELPGILSVKSGYTGGQGENPTYHEICSGNSGHYEAIQIHFDPSQVQYQQLLDTFWKQIDPTDQGGQFYDRGQQYETAIFYNDEEQKKQAELSKKQLEASSKFTRPITTKILKACTFYQAEEYHQEYHIKNPEHYRQYKVGSGREAFLKNLWGESNHG